MTSKKLVEQFQCPGCVCGSDTKCGSYHLVNNYGAYCNGHVLGTRIYPGVGSIALGLPKGFCRPGPDDSRKDTRNKIDIRLWTKGTQPEWDKFNVPVWALEQEGFLYVRTYSPRINRTYVDVIESGTFALVADAINVGEFIDEID